MKTWHTQWCRDSVVTLLSRIVFFSAFALLVTGCGTITSRNHNPAIPDSYGMKYPQGGNPPRIYSGTTADILTMAGSGHNADGGLTLIIDLPLSFVADTVLLPVTVYEQFFAKQTLQVAAAKGDADTVQKMLDGGHDINAKDKYGLTALMQAAWAGRLEIVQLLLGKGARPNEQHEITGATALMYAVDRDFDKSTNDNYANIALLLLNNGAEINTKNSKGESAFTITLRSHNAALMKVLLDKSADINSRDSAGWSALTYAIRSVIYFYGSTDFVLMLLNAGAEVTSSEVCMSIGYGWRGDPIVLGMLLNKGTNPNTTFCEGETLLGDAASSGRIREVKLLIEKGAKVNAINEGGGKYCNSCSALMHAAKNGHVDVVKLLIDNGADVKAKTHLGQTALTYTTSSKFPSKKDQDEIVKLLKEAGATE